MDDHGTAEQDAARLLKRQLLMSGVVTAVGIALHNFPEGIAVFLAAQKSPAVGECLSGYSPLVLGIYMDSSCAASVKQCGSTHHRSAVQQWCADASTAAVDGN